MLFTRNKRTFAVSLIAFTALFAPRCHATDMNDMNPFEAETEETLTVHLPAAPPTAARAFTRLPLSFVRNEGQADPVTKFEVRGRGYLLSLEQTEAVMVLFESREHDEQERWGARAHPSCVDGGEKNARPHPGPLPQERENHPPLLGDADGFGFWTPSKTNVISETKTRAASELSSDAAWPSLSSGERAGVRASVEPHLPVFHVLRMCMIGANPFASVTGEDELPGKFNYFIGNDPSLWRTNISTFAKVRYREIYPGIDLVYYGNEGQLEYDFVVAPGADPNRIALAVEGAENVRVDEVGDLVLAVGGREIRWRKPKIFQEKNGSRIEVAGEYALRPQASDDDSRPTHHVTFRVAAYDPALTLVIDPVLAYSTYLGGNLSDSAYAVAVDAQGNAYVTGTTWSQSNFPTTAGSIKRTFSVAGAAFVTKFSPAGDKLIYSTVLTGNKTPFDESFGYAIAVDGAGNAVVAGTTSTQNFPVKNALQPQLAGDLDAIEGKGDAFVTKLSADGAALIFSTYLGGSDRDHASSMALDASGNVYVTGWTRSMDFPMSHAMQPDLGGNEFASFAAKIADDGSSLIYSTYLGLGTGGTLAYLAVDSSQRACIAWTNEQLPRDASTSDVTVARLNADGSALDFQKSNFLRKPGASGGYANVSGLALDSSGGIYVTGSTTAPSDFQTTPNAFQPAFAGGYSDVFVAKFNSSSLNLEYLTYVGGASELELSRAITVDGAGSAYVVGRTESADFPTADPVQAKLNNGVATPASDAFVFKLSPDGSRLVWSTFLGGSKAPNGDSSDEAGGCALGPDGALYVVGATGSSNFPVQNPFQRSLKVQPGWLARDAFVTKIIVAPPPTMQVTRSGSSVSISWLLAAGGFALESSEALTFATTWSVVSGASEIVGDQNVVTIEIGSSPQFFRLRKP